MTLTALHPFSWLARLVLALISVAVLATASPVLADTFVNRWTQAQIGVQGNAAVVSAGAIGANWVREEAGDGFIRLKDAATGLYLHIENGPLELGAVPANFWSSHWVLEDTGDGFVRIRNRWKGTYINNEKGPLVASPAEPGYWSAQWQWQRPQRLFPETYRSPIEGRATKPRTFGEQAWLTSHNAFVNYTDARWTTPNQSRGIIGQLDNGVRGLMLDTYDFAGSGTALCVVSISADCYPAGVYLCHGDCNKYPVPGTTYALPRQNLKDVLDAIGDWLTRNTGERDVVTLFFEDYTANGTLASVIRSSRAAPFIFNPSASPWYVSSNGWPTLGAMKAANKRLLLFTSKSENANTSLGLVHDQSFNVENYWSLGDMGTNTECKSRWSTPLTDKGTNFNKLFVMNHFRNVPTIATADIDNKLTKLQSRLDTCKTAAGRLPNYVALDFIERGSGADFVVELNGKWVEEVNK